MKRLAKKAVVFLLIGVMMAGTCVITSHGVTKTSSEITIVFSHDTHSHLEKYAKIKTLIDRTKKENKSTFVVDAGDFSMGTPFQTIYTSEASELRMMGYVGYDVTTLGNHEFDYRSIGLSTMLSRAMYSGDKLPQLVISNIDWKTTLADKDQKENGEILKNTLKAYGAKDYVVLQRGGMKIACFGIFGKESASYAPESGTNFADPIETA